MNYGMPYKGSKNKIAKWIMENLPPADTFVDLFGGGGAVSHAAVLSGKYKHVIYNDLDPIAVNGLKMAVNGEFKGEERWISREEFFRLKDSDPYVAMCFSFGNDCRAYMYSPENERYKKRLHKLIFWREWQPLFEYFGGLIYKEPLQALCKIEDRKERRLKYRSLVLQQMADKGWIVKRGSHYYLKPLGQIDFLQSLERLERLQSLESLPTFDILNLDYREVTIPQNSVVYCDIPYKNTNKYKIPFSHDNFYTWARVQPFAVYVSEYDMPEDFKEIASRYKACLMCDKTAIKTTEKIFISR